MKADTVACPGFVFNIAPTTLLTVGSGDRFDSLREMRMRHRKIPAYKAADIAFARGLGLLSIGLGLIDTLGRRSVARKTGLPNEPLITLIGLREIATGFGLVIAEDPMPWVWGRVGGDALDIGALAMGVSPRNPERQGALVGLLVVAALTVVDVALAVRLHAAAEEQASRPLIA